MASIVCGKCRSVHGSVTNVRRCYAGTLTVCLHPVQDSDGSGVLTSDCGADAVRDDAGYVVCEAGHRYDPDASAEDRDGEPEEPYLPTYTDWAKYRYPTWLGDAV